MTIKKHKYLKLVVDNTRIGKISALIKKQSQLIKGKLQLQKERKIINTLLRKYEDNIIIIENKLNKYKGGK